MKQKPLDIAPWTVVTAQLEMLARNKRDCLIATGIAIVAGFFTLAAREYIALGILAGVVLMFWIRYWITKRRINRGQFLSNAEEAKELIGFVLNHEKIRSGKWGTPHPETQTGPPVGREVLEAYNPHPDLYK